MKQSIIGLFFVLFLVNTTFANEQISETEKLTLTGKVWGFLKYYHPNVAEGKFNWDDELFRILPKVKASTTKEDLSQVYLEWIQGLGQVKKCNKCIKTNEAETFDKNFNLNWITNSQILTPEVIKELLFIEQNRHQGQQYYVTANKTTGYATISNEIVYKDLDWTNEDFRLLTLFRYWNIIEYFFPYKYQTDVNWDAVLTKLSVQFLHAQSELDFHLAMLELVVSIDDSHADFFTNTLATYFGIYMLPVNLDIIEDQAVITGYFNTEFAEQDDLKIGDVILKIDNITIEDIFSDRIKYIPGSNIPKKKDKAYHKVFKGTTNKVTIEYMRDNQIKTKQVSRYQYQELNFKREVSNERFKILDDSIGYINMCELTIEEVPSAMEALKHTKSIIFDIRNTPNETLYAISNYINSEERDFYKVIYPDLNYPGKFIWRDGITCGSNGELKYLGKIVLLVNENAQSHAEFTIMCLQTGDNVTTIGSQTSGADGEVSYIAMAGGEMTMFTGVGMFYPDKTETQRKGIKIDIVVQPTIKGIMEGKDELLERAITFLNE